MNKSLLKWSGIVLILIGFIKLITSFGHIENFEEAGKLIDSIFLTVFGIYLFFKSKKIQNKEE